MSHSSRVADGDGMARPGRSGPRGGGSDRLIATVKDWKQRRAARDMGTTTRPPSQGASAVKAKEHHKSCRSERSTSSPRNAGDLTLGATDQFCDSLSDAQEPAVNSWMPRRACQRLMIGAPGSKPGAERASHQG